MSYAQWSRNMKAALDKYLKDRKGDAPISDAAVAPEPTQIGLLLPSIHAMVIDNRKQLPEQIQLYLMFMSSPVFDGVEPDAFVALVERLESEFVPLDPQQRLDRIKACAEILSPNLRETAYAYAVRMIWADGMVGAAERALLDKLWQTMQIGEKRAAAIREVVEILSHPAMA